MQTLWAPWRMKYILAPKPDTCPFCLPKHMAKPVAKPVANAKNSDEKDDEHRFIVKRGKYSFVLLNKFPYNNGHLMVTPYRHVMGITELSQDEAYEITDMINLSVQALKLYCSPQGLNIGLNMGAAAGAGVAGHIHYHLVPRWNGDSSFMAVLDEIRVIPEHIEKTYQELLKIFDNLQLES